LFLVLAVLAVQKNVTWTKVFSDKKSLALLVSASVLITANWGMYIWAVNAGRILETSLGYYITPLLCIFFGLIVFKERLKKIQWFAFALVAAAVTLQTVNTGSLPWISLGLAFSFGLYSMLKKRISLSATESLAIETLFASPIAIFLLLSPNPSNLSYLTTDIPWYTFLLLFFCGAATMIPLFLFAKGVKILPLSAVGFVQLLSPTMTFLQGTLLFNEEFNMVKLFVFILIWASAILYAISLRAK
jgi:chloramphenicol-sensitive protein RarD